MDSDDTDFWGWAVGLVIAGFIGYQMFHQPAAATPPATTDTIQSVSDTSTDDDSSYYQQEEDDCNPNYSGCVENSSYDLDCADIGEEVEVIGYDEYGLDRDEDGYGCESY